MQRALIPDDQEPAVIAPATQEDPTTATPANPEKGALGIALLVWLLGGSLGLVLLVFLLAKIF
jgi:hypothetical protein